MDNAESRAARLLLSSRPRRYRKIFRIQFDPTPEGLRCRLAGRLDAESAAEARSVLAGSAGVRFADLSDLGAVDEAGLVLLADLRAAQVALEGLSPYLALRLEGLRDDRSGTFGRGRR